MGPWPPDEEQEYPEPQDEGQSPLPVAFVSTQQSIPLQVDEVADERTPEGMVCMGTFFNERLIARSIISPEALAEIEHQDVFAVPVRLGLAAVENEPGLQCRLYALLPATQFLEKEDEPEEPWLASVPRFEDVTKQEEKAEEEAIVPLLLGHIVRFQRDRRHPDNLAAEAADILRAILSEERPLTDVIDKILEEL
ncbi:MAG: hypothetical protein AMS18_08825 [Gemmatimonas sp. SG8_17]|nr:MAG: hypothetical protein AMS18_08825 [Gemmatimonas sp. SG8_17]